MTKLKCTSLSEIVTELFDTGLVLSLRVELSEKLPKLNDLLNRGHLTNWKVMQLLVLQEGNINESHFSFVTIQLTESKPLVQLSPMSCLLQGAVIENCCWGQWTRMWTNTNNKPPPHQKKQRTNKTSWSLLMPKHYATDSKDLGLLHLWSIKFHLKEQPIDGWPPICWQHTQQIDARPHADVNRSMADAAGPCCDDCFLSCFKKRHLWHVYTHTHMHTHTNVRRFL